LTVGALVAVVVDDDDVVVVALAGLGTVADEVAVRHPRIINERTEESIVGRTTLKQSEREFLIYLSLDCSDSPSRFVGFTRCGWISWNYNLRGVAGPTGFGCRYPCGEMGAKILEISS